MAPNKRGGPLKSSPAEGGMISKEEVEARGTGTKEDQDTYDSSQFLFSEVRVCFTGLMFLTRLPCPHWTDHHPAFLMRSAMWFPALGALVGCWAAVWYSALATLWSPGVAAALSTLASVWLTGCFHEDGLSDCFDGFGGGWGRVQILRIMKDSRVGTYALVGVLLCTYAKLTLLSEMEPADVPRALVAAHTIGRWTSLPLLHFCHYLQDDEDAKRGMYNWFAQSQRLFSKPRLLLGTLAAAGIGTAAVGPAWTAALMGLCTGLCVAAGAYGYAVIGGVVGDFLGATIMVAELAVYMALSARWDSLAGASAWPPLLACAAVSAVPVLYARRIVDFNASC
eukprot:jgi/Tetstr1/425333/TSEL_015782.t1